MCLNCYKNNFLELTVKSLDLLKTNTLLKGIRTFHYEPSTTEVKKEHLLPGTILAHLRVQKS